MTWLDWVLIGWFVIVFITSWRIGLMYRLGNVVGLVIGLYLASHYYVTISHFFSLNHWSEFGVYIFVLVGIFVCSGLGAVLLNKAFKLISWLPFLSSLNHILGAILGVVVQLLLLSAITLFLSRIELLPSITLAISQSWVAQWLIVLANVFSWLLPTTYAG